MHHKRRGPRVPLEIRVEYKHLNAFLADMTRDLSASGLFVRTAQPLPEGSECLFSLTVPTLDHPVVVPGVVRRSLAPGPEAEEGAADGAERDQVGMGVELQFADDDERKAFERLVHGLMFQHLGPAVYDRVIRLRRRDEDS